MASANSVAFRLYCVVMSERICGKGKPPEIRSPQGAIRLWRLRLCHRVPRNCAHPQNGKLMNNPPAGEFERDCRFATDLASGGYIKMSSCPSC